MSRTYRMRRYSVAKGEHRKHLYVNASMQKPMNRTREEWLSRLAHDELKLPCVSPGGTTGACYGWKHSHMRCLPEDVRLQLHSSNLWERDFANLRTVPLYAHPFISFYSGIAMVPTSAKRYGRKQAYRQASRGRSGRSWSAEFARATGGRPALMKALSLMPS